LKLSPFRLALGEIDACTPESGLSFFWGGEFFGQAGQLFQSILEGAALDEVLGTQQAFSGARVGGEELREGGFRQSLLGPPPMRVEGEAYSQLKQGPPCFFIFFHTQVIQGEEEEGLRVLGGQSVQYFEGSGILFLEEEQLCVAP